MYKNTATITNLLNLHQTTILIKQKYTVDSHFTPANKEPNSKNSAQNYHQLLSFVYICS